MASTHLMRNALWRVSSLLQDADPQFDRWGERELVQWFNDAQSCIAAYVPSSCARVDAIKLQPGTLQWVGAVPAASVKPQDGSTQTGTLHIRRVRAVRRNLGADGTKPGLAIRPLERDTLDAHAPNWHSETGTVIEGWIADPVKANYFSVTPGVKVGGSVWVEVASVADPLAIPAGGAPGAEIYAFSGSSTQTITIDDEYLEDLVDYVCARAHMKESKYAEPVRSAFHTQRFLASLNFKTQADTGANPNLTELPGVSAPGAKA